MANPFEAPGSWLRCALHAHSTNSDGELAAALLAHHYERAGFDLLSITDHWIRTEEQSTERLLLVPGAEIDVRIPGRDREAHVLALGLDASPERPAGEFPPLDETVEWVSAHGGISYLAHPYWSGLRTHQFERCEGLLGLEVYNASCEVETGRGLSSVHWDEALETGRPWLAIAVDDCHHPGFDSALAWTWVRATERSQRAVLAALAEGTFYSSTGPVIEDVSVDGGTVEVRCTPARRITLLTGSRRGASVVAGRLGYSSRGEVLERSEEGVVAVRLVAPRGAPYARVEVEGRNGGIAWTNPLWP